MKDRRQRHTLTDELKGHDAIRHEESAADERESKRAARRTHQGDFGDVSHPLNSSLVLDWQFGREHESTPTDELTQDSDVVASAAETAAAAFSTTSPSPVANGGSRGGGSVRRGVSRSNEKFVRRERSLNDHDHDLELDARRHGDAVAVAMKMSGGGVMTEAILAHSAGKRQAQERAGFVSLPAALPTTWMAASSMDDRTGIARRTGPTSEALTVALDQASGSKGRQSPMSSVTGPDSSPDPGSWTRHMTRNDRR